MTLRAKLGKLFVAAVAVAATLVATPNAASANTNLIIGSTWTPAAYDTKIPKWSDPAVIQSDGVEITRVFWANGSGCPTWTDTRIQKLKAHNIIPFISFKDYSLACMQALLDTLPADIPIAYFTWYHEGEANMDAATWKTRQNAMYSVVKAHAKWAAGRVKYMSVQTKQWTDIHAAGNYGTYWCNCGDFFAADAYANSWDNAYPNPDTFLTGMMNFAVNNSGGRSLFLPELGAIQMPSDPTDNGRAAWINQVMYRANTWSRFAGVIWWDAIGTPAADGAARNFDVEQESGINSPSAVAWRNTLSHN